MALQVSDQFVHVITGQTMAGHHGFQASAERIKNSFLLLRERCGIWMIDLHTTQRPYLNQR